MTNDRFETLSSDQTATVTGGTGLPTVPVGPILPPKPVVDAAVRAGQWVGEKVRGLFNR